MAELIYGELDMQGSFISPYHKEDTLHHENSKACEDDIETDPLDSSLRREILLETVYKDSENKIHNDNETIEVDENDVCIYINIFVTNQGMEENKGNSLYFESDNIAGDVNLVFYEKIESECEINRKNNLLNEEDRKRI